MAGRPPEPKREMFTGLDGMKMLVKLEKNILRNFLRSRSVVKKTIGDTKHHRLMHAHQPCKSRLVAFNRSS